MGIGRLVQVKRFGQSVIDVCCFDKMCTYKKLHNPLESLCVSVCLSVRRQLAKMLRTLELPGIFTSNYVYLCTLTLSNICHAKRLRGFADHHLLFHTFLLAAKTTLSTFNTGCAYYCQLIEFIFEHIILSCVWAWTKTYNLWPTRIGHKPRLA